MKYDYHGLTWTMHALKLGENVLASASVVLHKEWLKPSNDLSLSSTQLSISKKAKICILNTLKYVTIFFRLWRFTKLKMVYKVVM